MMEFFGISNITLCKSWSTLCISTNIICICMKYMTCYSERYLKGCGMGPWLVLVSPCFRVNVVATCKIGSFLCSLDNLLQKNVIIVLFFGNHISKWRSFEKRVILTYFSHFLVTRESYKILSAHISLTLTRICSPYWLFLPYQFWKKYEFIRYGFSLVWILVLIRIRAILEQSINNKTDMYLH